MRDSKKEWVLVAVVVVIGIGLVFLNRGIVGKLTVSRFFNWIGSLNEYEVSVNPADLPIERKVPETISMQEMLRLREMVRRQETQKLNSTLAQYQEAFEKNPLTEYKIYDAYLAFNIPDLILAESIERWKKLTPDAYQPYLAAAQCYYALGWKKRGTKYAMVTKKEKFDGMRDYFTTAEANLLTAIRLKPNLMPAFDVLIGLYVTSGQDEKSEVAIAIALERFPQSYLIRNQICWAMEPRWGDSYEKMEQIAMTAEPYYQTNPRLTALYGKIYADRGDYMFLRNKGKEAVEFYNKAISFGDDWQFYRERARAYHLDLEDRGRALKDINQSIEIRPNKSRNHIVRSEVYFALGKFAESLEDYDIARQLAPGTDDVKKWGNWASLELQKRGHNIFKEDLKAAVAYYDISLKYQEPNEEVHYWRGMAKHRLNDAKGALADFERCFEINPGHFDSCRMIDSVLSREAQWDTIIAYWTTFLEHQPNHGRAYYKRSGAHIQKRDRDRAFSDLRKSCELKYEDACKMLQGIMAKENKGAS